jgi:hypothetical protein
LTDSKQNNSVIGQGHVCTCSEHHSLQAATTDFWNTPAGILRSIDGLAQDLLFLTVNNAFKMVAPTNGVKWMLWVTAEDDRVCDRCIAASQGGRNGYYRVSWFMPKMPIHPNDRCQWELVLYDPFALWEDYEKSFKP